MSNNRVLSCDRVCSGVIVVSCDSGVAKSSNNRVHLVIGVYIIAYHVTAEVQVMQ